jgi:hypothetical protein
MRSAIRDYLRMKRPKRSIDELAVALRREREKIFNDKKGGVIAAKNRFEAQYVARSSPSKTAPAQAKSVTFRDTFRL